MPEEKVAERREDAMLREYNSFLLKWNRVFLYLFMVLYSANTFIFANITDLGLFLVPRVFVILYAAVVVALSHISERVYDNLPKYTYVAVYAIIFNTASTVVISGASPTSLLYFGGSAIILTYMYLDRWYLYSYLLWVYALSWWALSTALGSVQAAVPGTSLMLFLLMYCMVFFKLKKYSDNKATEYLKQLVVEVRRRRRAEKELNRMAAFYKSVTDGLPVGIMTVSFSGEIIMANSVMVPSDQMRNWSSGKSVGKLLEALGYSREDISCVEDVVRTGDSSGCVKFAVSPVQAEGYYIFVSRCANS